MKEGELTVNMVHLQKFAAKGWLRAREVGEARHGKISLHAGFEVAAGPHAFLRDHARSSVSGTEIFLESEFEVLRLRACQTTTPHSIIFRTSRTGMDQLYTNNSVRVCTTVLIVGVSGIISDFFL